MTARPSTLIGVFAGGAALGAALVYLVMRPGPPAPAPAAPPQVAAAQPGPRVLGNGTAWVTFANGVDQRRVLGVVLAGHDVLVIGFDDFVSSDDAWWHGANGIRRALREAVAWDLDVGLVAFAVGEARGDGITLSDEDGALYLGREVVVVGDTSRTDGFVDSAAISVGPSDYRYEIKTREAVEDRTAAIVLPQSGELIGLSVGGATDAIGLRVQALDAATLRDLLALRARTRPLSIGDFSAYVLSTPQGMLAELTRSVDSGRWRAALDLAERLRATFPERLTGTVRTQARTSAAQLVKGYVAAGQPDAAIATAVMALAGFGASEELLRLASDMYLNLGQIDEAIALLRRFEQAGAGEGDASLEERRALLRRLTTLRARDAQIAPATAMTLLREAIETDADFAPYHRLLGGLYYDAGRYTEAAFHLQRAVELDPQYAADVELALRQSRQRQEATTMIEAPMESAGGALFVNARVNGSAESFRFLLDTGASYTAINTATLLRLGYSEVFARGAPPVELETASGRIFAGSFTIDSIDVAGALVRDVPVVILEDMGPLDGLLGLSFLRHFDVDINQREGKLLLTPR